MEDKKKSKIEVIDIIVSNVLYYFHDVLFRYFFVVLPRLLIY